MSGSGRRIRDIQTAVVEANYDWTFVKVRTEDGLTGYGEAVMAPGLTTLIRKLAPLLIGKDSADIGLIGRIVREAGITAGPLGGPVNHALAALETALLDILGQRAGLPIFRLFGGAYRKQIRLYADCHGSQGLSSLSDVMVPRIPWWMSEGGQTTHFYEVHVKAHGGLKEEAQHLPDPSAYAERAREVVSLGYTALKFDLDIPNPYSRDEFNRVLEAEEIDLLSSIVAAVREAVGPSVDIAVDCHWHFSALSALQLGEALKPFRLLWMEDPVPPDALEALAAVTQKSPIPIATGEHHFLLSQFHDLIVRGGVTIVAPDFQKTGLMEGKKIADLAESFTVPAAPHNIASPIGTIASAHLCAAIPNLLCLEHHGMDVPFWEEIVSGWSGPIIQNGHIDLSDERPGLGIALNEEVAYQYRKKDEPFFDRY
ncbi:MAG: mandelate racemase/muconate lactonizing enzyme family protein [Armatimonadetes bacterium]|nr:mandelate racemase/muconate lactonizing enzyme family protein [Armatimonadota bacterium]MDW8120704.1 mandelate racemase/muconate lactonizing enzyme family protein [Armatimonadota bacterium]